jgi:hypothetical protein
MAWIRQISILRLSSIGLACLLTGAVLNLLMAVVLENIQLQKLQAVSGNQFPTAWPASIPTGWPVIPAVTNEFAAFGVNSTYAVSLDFPLPGSASSVSWTSLDGPRINFLYVHGGVEHLRVGWPLRTVQGSRWGSAEIGNPDLDQSSDIFIFGSRKGRKYIFARTPIWLGVIVNTVFWSAMVFGAWLFIFGGRRKLRRREDMCQRCAYSCIGLSADGLCPECGTPRR